MRNNAGQTTAAGRHRGRRKFAEPSYAAAIRGSESLSPHKGARKSSTTWFRRQSDRKIQRSMNVLLPCRVLTVRINELVWIPFETTGAMKLEFFSLQISWPALTLTHSDPIDRYRGSSTLQLITFQLPVATVTYLKKRECVEHSQSGPIVGCKAHYVVQPETSSTQGQSLVVKRMIQPETLL